MALHDAVTYFSGRYIHQRGIQNLDVIKMIVSILKCQSVSPGLGFVQNIKGRKTLALFHQLTTETDYIETGARIDRHTILCNNPREIPPPVDGRKIVSANYQCELVVWFTPFQCIQSLDRIMWRRHLQFNVIHLDIELRMTPKSLYGSIEPGLPGIRTDVALQWVLRGNNEIHPVEFLFVGEIFHYGLVADMQWIERTGIDGNPNDLF